MKQVLILVLAGAAFCALGAEPKAAVIKGTVLDATGKPVSNATVAVYSKGDIRTALADDEMLPKTFTATNATFEVQLSSYGTILVWKQGLAPDWRNIYGLGAGEGQDEKFVLSSPADVSGLVVDSGGKPMSDVEVFVAQASLETPVEGSIPQSSYSGKFLKENFKAKTGTDGEFAIKGLPTNATLRFDVKAEGMCLKLSELETGYQTHLPWRAGQEKVRLELEKTGAIEGRIAAVPSGAEIPEATLRLKPVTAYITGKALPKEVPSAKDGTFRIANVSPGDYRIQAKFGTNTFPEWVAEPEKVSVESGKTATLEKPIAPTSGGVAEVSVLNEKTRKPANKMSVHAYSETTQEGAKTDKEGKAYLRLVPGNYQFAASSQAGQAPNVTGTVEAGKTNRVELEFRAPAVAKGVVLSPDGKAAVGVQMWAVGGSSSHAKPHTTDAGGKFELGVSSPSYSGGYETITILARDMKNNLAAAQEFSEDDESMELRLEPGLTITGKVVSGNEPLVDAKVALIYWTGNRGMHLNDFARKADIPGAFEVPALPKGGKYGIAASMPGYGNNQVHSLVSEDGADRIDAGTLELNKANLQISGTVVDENDKPVKGAQVGLHGQGQPSSQVQTDKDGRFTFKSVCEGPASLYAHSQQSSGNVSAEGGETNVVLRLGAQMAVSSGPSAHKLLGIVTKPDGKPASGAKAAVFPSQGTTLWSTVKEDGSYAIRWSAQSWQLESGDPVLVIRFPEQNLAVSETFAEDSTNLNVRLQPAWTLKGKVEDSDGNPLRNVEINLQLLAGRMYSSLDGKPSTTDGEGKFEIPSVPSGPKYYITASLKGYGQGRQEVESEKEAGDLILETFKLNLADKIVAGQVLDKNNKPASAHIQVLGDDQPQVYEQTGKDGRFKFNVCEGEVRLWANGQNSYGEVTVAAGETNVVINLQSYDAPRRTVSQRPALKGKPLPDCSVVGVAAAAIPSGKPALICLMDAEQRPSRRAARLLSEQNAALKNKGIAVVCVQAIPAEDSVFSEWTNSAALPFVIGRVLEKTPENKWATEVNSLPWLILRDSKGLVVEEGFSLEDLEKKLMGLKQ